MATATFAIPDFHRIDNAHAGRTQQKRSMTERLSLLERENAQVNTLTTDWLQLISQAWGVMTFEERRDVLRAAIVHITIPSKGETPIIAWNR